MLHFYCMCRFWVINTVLLFAILNRSWSSEVNNPVPGVLPNSPATKGHTAFAVGKFYMLFLVAYGCIHSTYT